MCSVKAWMFDQFIHCVYSALQCKVLFYSKLHSLSINNQWSKVKQSIPALYVIPAYPNKQLCRQCFFLNDTILWTIFIHLLPPNLFRVTEGAGPVVIRYILVITSPSQDQIQRQTQATNNYSHSYPYSGQFRMNPVCVFLFLFFLDRDRGNTTHNLTERSPGHLSFFSP